MAWLGGIIEFAGAVISLLMSTAAILLRTAYVAACLLGASFSFSRRDL